MVGPPPIVHAQVSTQVGLIQDTNLQAVTTQATALSAMPATVVCVKGTVGNANTIWAGTRSNITAGTAGTSGFGLGPGDTACFPVKNTNLVYVVAASTGSSANWYTTTP